MQARKWHKLYEEISKQMTPVTIDDIRENVFRVREELIRFTGWDVPASPSSVAKLCLRIFDKELGGVFKDGDAVSAKLGPRWWDEDTETTFI